MTGTYPREENPSLVISPGGDGDRVAVLHLAHLLIVLGAQQPRLRPLPVCVWRQPFVLHYPGRLLHANRPVVTYGRWRRRPRLQTALLGQTVVVTVRDRRKRFGNNQVARWGARSLDGRPLLCSLVRQRSTGRGDPLYTICWWSGGSCRFLQEAKMNKVVLFEFKTIP